MQAQIRRVYRSYHEQCQNFLQARVLALAARARRSSRRRLSCLGVSHAQGTQVIAKLGCVQRVRRMTCKPGNIPANRTLRGGKLLFAACQTPDIDASVGLVVTK